MDLRKELLTMQHWQALIDDKRRQPPTIEQVYQTILYEQYNLHLMDYTRLDGHIKYVKWKNWASSNPIVDQQNLQAVHSVEDEQKRHEKATHSNDFVSFLL